MRRDESIQLARKSILLILSAPSGAGKTSLAHRLREEFGKSCVFSISYTTRPPRGAERDGVDYCFVGREQFEMMNASGEFLECAEVHGNLYGTHRSYAAPIKGVKVVIFDIDVQGGEQIKAKHPEAVSIFILPPSMEELERRLRGRGTDEDSVIERRLVTAQLEIERGQQSYDYLVVNDDLDEAVADVRAILRAEGCRRR